MAKNLLTSYDARNFVLLDDYKMRLNSLDVGQPEVAVVLSGNSQPTVAFVTWKRGVMHESCRFQYVGMDYDTAQDCADSMRSRFQYSKPTWQYGAYMDGGNLLYGWHQGTALPALDTNVTVQKHGTGCMYDVLVDAQAEVETYTRGGFADATGTRPVYNALTGVPGWSATEQLSGEHFDAAGADNIVLVNAPSRNVSYELVAENLFTTKISSDGEVVLVKDNWYRRTVDSYAQVKYEGLTKTACRNLYSSLSKFNSSGWYGQQHPWELSAWWQQAGTGWQLHIEWVQNTSVTSWQCLNDYSARQEEGGLWTAELMLHAQQVSMTTQADNSYSWPSEWSNIPGLAAYL